jgi:hypothetical protein
VIGSRDGRPVSPPEQLPAETTRLAAAPFAPAGIKRTLAGPVSKDLHAQLNLEAENQMRCFLWSR